MERSSSLTHYSKECFVSSMMMNDVKRASYIQQDIRGGERVADVTIIKTKLKGDSTVMGISFYQIL